jgi:hypothetical protein
MKSSLTLLLLILIFNETFAQQELIAPNLFPKRTIQPLIIGQKKNKKLYPI